jgi:DNA-binding response OmpR family regulator
VARILIAEPNDDHRILYTTVVSEMGHDVVSCEASEVVSPDVALVEPAAPECFHLALRLRLRKPRQPIVCASIYAPWPSASLLSPVAYLVKPFGLGELRAALQKALVRTSDLRP